MRKREGEKGGEGVGKTESRKRYWSSGVYNRKVNRSIPAYAFRHHSPTPLLPHSPTSSVRRLIGRRARWRAIAGRAIAWPLRWIILRRVGGRRLIALALFKQSDADEAAKRRHADGDQREDEPDHQPRQHPVILCKGDHAIDGFL